MTNLKRFIPSPATASHVVPFLLWIGVMVVLQAVETFAALPPAVYPWSYAAKTVVCGALILWLRPWQYYKPATKLTAGKVALGVGVGVAVTVAWVLPETVWTARYFPGFQEFYNRWFILMPGKFPSYFDPVYFPELPPGHASLAYAPEANGWILTVFKLVGSAFVIAVAEEYFFRGFFYRWMQNARFTEVPLGRYDASAFWLVVLVFAIEHDRWFGGALAGVAYGWLAVRTGDVRPAVIAHVVTNLLLGLHVVLSKQYGFW